MNSASRAAIGSSDRPLLFPFAWMLIVYFPLVYILGGTDREELKALIKRRRPYTDAG